MGILPVGHSKKVFSIVKKRTLMQSCVQIINHLHEDLNQHVFLCKLPTGNCSLHHDNTSQPLSTAGFNGEGGTDSPGSAADGRA